MFESTTQAQLTLRLPWRVASAILALLALLIARPVDAQWLFEGQQLHPDQWVESSNLRYRFTNHGDGRLSIADNGYEIWHAGPFGAGVLSMQSDGNLVMYVGGNPVWDTGCCAPGSYFVMQDDGNAVVYRPDNSAAWNAGTWSPAAPPGHLYKGGEIWTGDDLASANDLHRLANEPNGDLVLHRNGLPPLLISSGAPGPLRMQWDGNLVLYRSGEAPWHTSTHGNPDAYLHLEDNGALSVRASGGAVLHAIAGGGSSPGGITVHGQGEGQTVAIRVKRTFAMVVPEPLTGYGDVWFHVLQLPGNTPVTTCTLAPGATTCTQTDGYPAPITGRVALYSSEVTDNGTPYPFAFGPNITFVQPVITVNGSTTQQTIAPGQGLDVAFQNPSGGPLDYVALVRTDAGGAGEVQRKYLNGDPLQPPPQAEEHPTVHFTLPNQGQAATYQFRFFDGESNLQVASSATLVYSGPPPITVYGAAEGQTVTIRVNRDYSVDFPQPLDLPGELYLHLLRVPGGDILGTCPVAFMATTASCNNGYPVPLVGRLALYSSEIVDNGQPFPLAFGPNINFVRPPVTVNGSSGMLTVTPGQVIEAHAENPYGGPLDYMALYRIDQVPAVEVDRKFLNDSTSPPGGYVPDAYVHLTIPALQQNAAFEVRFYDGENSLLVSTSPGLAITQFNPTLTINGRTSGLVELRVKEPAVFTFTQLTSWPGIDLWLSITSPSSSPCSGQSSSYWISGGNLPPSPWVPNWTCGQFNVVFYFTDPQAGNLPIEQFQLQVKTPTVYTENYGPGQSVSVGRNQPITLAFTEGPEDTGATIRICRTSPSTPGCVSGWFLDGQQAPPAQAIPSRLLDVTNAVPPPTAPAVDGQYQARLFLPGDVQIAAGPLLNVSGTVINGPYITINGVGPRPDPLPISPGQTLNVALLQGPVNPTDRIIIVRSSTGQNEYPPIVVGASTSWTLPGPMQDGMFFVRLISETGLIIGPGGPTLQLGGLGGVDTVTFLDTDAIGSVRRLSGPNGIVRRDYTPFGWEFNYSGAGGDDRIRFAGRERDTETDLNYFGARYYAHLTGRFTAIDPVLDVEDALTNPQRWNRFTYVSNNPLRKIDPDGRYEIDVHRYLTAVLARAAGLSPKMATDIADATQGVDESFSTHPFFAPWNLDENHFTTDETRQSQWERFQRSGSPSDLGIFLHSFQDSYSHAGFGPIPGHAGYSGCSFPCHDPDKTYLRPDLADRMSAATFQRLQSASTRMGGRNNGLSWKDISPYVQRFNRARSLEDKLGALNDLIKVVHEHEIY